MFLKKVNNLFYFWKCFRREYKKSEFKIFKELVNELKKKEVPMWLSLNKDKLEAKTIGEPSLEEVKPPAELSLIFEFYSR